MHWRRAAVHDEQRARSFVDRWFPAPMFLTPRAAGIDISDASVKWLTLSPANGASRHVVAYGDVPLAKGIVTGGVVRDERELAQALVEIRPLLGGVLAAHAALPEEAAYVFSMHVPDKSDREEIMHLIEFEFEGRVPIPPSAAIYDFSMIEEHPDGSGMEIGVVAFPRELVEAYVSAFRDAGITLLSLEIEARSIARATLSEDARAPITLLVDFGSTRTGISVVKRGIPIFTSTVEIGGDALPRAVSQALSLSHDEAEKFCNREGLVARQGVSKVGLEALVGTASALSDEIARHYHYWDTRRNEGGERVTPVGQVILVGGSSNLNGLPEYIAGRLQAEVSRGNVWRKVCSFDEYIPPIERRISLQYATAIGLALRSL